MSSGKKISRLYPVVDQDNYPKDDQPDQQDSIIKKFKGYINRYVILNKYIEAGLENSFLTFKRNLDTQSASVHQKSCQRASSNPISRHLQNDSMPSIDVPINNSNVQSNIEDEIVFLSHYYKDIPTTFNKKVFKKLLKFYMKNPNNSLSYLKGFSFTSINGYYFPIELTVRPNKGPLISLFSYDTIQSDHAIPKITAEGKFDIIIDIINGIVFIHQHKSVHSNLNPTTVYLNDKLEPFICDYFLQSIFQISKQNDDENQFNFSIDTETSSKIYQNDLYVAPEVLSGKEFGSSADIYSLGLLIYFILSEKEATNFNKEEDFKCPSDFPSKWKEIVEGCSKKEPSERLTLDDITKKVLDEKEALQLIESMTPKTESFKISVKTNLSMTNIKRNIDMYKGVNSCNLRIFKKMIPNSNEISNDIKIIILTAENGHISSIEKVGDFLSKGENNFYKDLEYALECYDYAAKKDSAYSLEKVAQAYENGYGTDINLNESYDKYNDLLNNFKSKNDPRQSEIEEKMKEINKKRNSILLKNFPYIDRFQIIFKHLNLHIISHEITKEGQLLIEFMDIKEVIAAKNHIKSDRYKKFNIKITTFLTKTIKTSRFDSLEKNLPKFDLNDIMLDDDKDLDKGAYAKTYIVRKKGSDEKLVAKEFISPIDDNSITINNFKREIIMSSKLKNHPAIVKYVGFSEYCLTNFLKKQSVNEIKPTLFMKYAPNGNLENAIINNSKEFWTNTRKMKIIIGIASGLSKMEELKIVHRDLKPKNILLDEDFNPLICDFGCSRQYSLNRNDNITEDIGTHVYMAPEMHKDHFNPVYGSEVDSYAFGIIVYQIIKLIKTEDVYNFKNPIISEKVSVRYDIMIKKDNNILPPDIDEFDPDLKDLIKSCWNTIMIERLTPKKIYERLIDVVDESLPFLEDLNFDELKEYIKKLNNY